MHNFSITNHPPRKTWEWTLEISRLFKKCFQAEKNIHETCATGIHSINVSGNSVQPTGTCQDSCQDGSRGRCVLNEVGQILSFF